MKNSKFFRNGSVLCVLVAGITGILLLILARVLEIWPFGDISLAFWDGNWQYIDYLVYFRDVLLGTRSLWYSLSTTLGNNMSAINGYYLLSPFNLLVLFFEKADMPVAFTLICMMKIIMCSVCFQIFLNQFEETRTTTLSVFFSVVYALCGYVFVYGYNYMWLDGVIALPLVAAGIHRLRTEKKNGLYQFGIAYGLITCYYVGYMLCIFSVLYFGVQWLFDRKREELFRYIGASLLAGGLSACVLFPVFMGLSNTEAEQTTMQVALQLNFDLKQLCSTFFLKPFVENDLANFALPKLFCGAGSFYFAIIYFCSQKTQRKEKVQYAILLMILLLSMCFNIPNLIWHGFKEPEGCPYRYSFIFTFLMLVCSARGCIISVKEKRTGFSGLVERFVSIGIALYVAVMAHFYGGTELKYVVVSVVLMLGAASVDCLKGKLLPTLAVAVVLLADVLHCGKIVWLQTTRYEDSTITTYREYVTNLSDIVEGQYDATEELVRLELKPEIRRSYNDAMVYNFPGISFYSSAEDTVVEEWLADMGICNWRETHDNGDAIDNLLGIRYRIGEDISENPMAFPLIWSANATAMHKSWQGINAAEELNRIYGAVGQDIEMVLEKIDPAWTAQGEMTTWEATVVIQESGEYAVAVDMTADFKRPYTEIYVNDQRVGFYSHEDTPLYYHVGSYDAGEIVQLEVRFAEEVTDCHLYREESKVLFEVADEVASQNGHLYKSESTFLMKLYGGISSKENQDIIVSIPYNRGWKAMVDGIPCDTYRAFGVFMGIEVEPGVHTVEMVYYPPGLWLGVLFSGVSMLYIGVMRIYKGRNNKADK